MSENEKKHFENDPATVAEKSSLNEDELDGVAGGFAIIDTCQNRWVPIICNALWGKCAHLTMTEKSKKTSGLNRHVIFSVSCSKGCFSNVEYRRDDSY